MAGKYDPSNREKHWQEFWDKNNVFKFDPKSTKPLYSIDTPPPTVSGKLHLGHVFSYTQTEVLARFWRMNGYNVYYPFGMDDNGLPTERLVEQELGIKGSEMNRKEFVAKCLETVARYRQNYRGLWESLGFSVDWNLLYSTISPEVVRLTQENFLDFYKRGLIYRKKAPALWCWVCQTSLAQAEVEDKEKEGVFYDVVFEDEKNNEVIVATTRPELIPACVAMFVNPEDKRHKHLVGTTITTPMGDRVKVLVDDKVKIDKGSGIVMCCTYGDETDLQWTVDNKLREKIIIGKDGRFDDNCSLVEMRGKGIMEGRGIMVEFLKGKNLIRAEKAIVHEVGCHERCGNPMEIINTDQWFVKVLEIKKELLDLADKINWYPQTMKARYLSWVENLKWDWCISRDRFYGAGIPVFYCQKCGGVVLPAGEELPIDPVWDKTSNKCLKCGSDELKGENLVFDTWFTSGNTPEINQKLNQEETGGKIGIPMRLRPQAHDIIRTWTFYTMVMSWYKNKKQPWEDVAISGHILLKKGEKISKRTGGGSIRPEDEISKHSADAIRYAMCGASLGLDAYYDEQELQNGKRLVTKLWNAGNFVEMMTKDGRVTKMDFDQMEKTDQWLMAEMGKTAKMARKYFEKYDYAHAREEIERFFWGKFCDLYLEIIKKRVYELEDDNPKKQSAIFCLRGAMLAIIKMLAPFVPHICEEIYQMLYAGSEVEKSIHLTSWPEMGVDFEAKVFEEIIKIIEMVRSEKSRLGVSLGAECDKLRLEHPWLTETEILPYQEDLLGVTRSQEMEIKKGKLFVVALDLKEKVEGK